MISPQDKKPASRLQNQDGYTRNFDSLIDHPLNVATEAMGHLSIVKQAAHPLAIDPNLKHTDDHNDCPACQASNAVLVISGEEFAAMTFEEAAKFWQLHRAQDLSLRAGTHATTQGYIDALKKFFGRMRLADITPGHLRSYQIARLRNEISSAAGVIHPWKRTCGHSIPNHEISVLAQMMTFARLWHRLKPYYNPLKQKQWSPCVVLTEEQEEHLWKTASKNPQAALAYWVATITNNTSASGIELRGLRLKHLFLTSQIAEIYIPEDSVKNGSRPRRIALNNTAHWAVEQCLKRAIRIGSHEPEHYLFPFRMKRNKYDPTRPASCTFLRKSWAKLQEASGFRDLTPHDLRHQCITKLLENDVNPETVIAIAGHVGRKMMEYYAHQRRRVKYAAVLALEPKTIKGTIAKESERRAG